MSANNNPFLRLSAAALQMAAVIGGFTWLGAYLDQRYASNQTLWTIILGLVGVGLGLYLVIKEVLHISKDK
ncbi:MAG: AtpZ/AtpI family protein [Flavobacteriales bacterium]